MAAIAASPYDQHAEPPGVPPKTGGSSLGLTTPRLTPRAPSSGAPTKGAPRHRRLRHHSEVPSRELEKPFTAVPIWLGFLTQEEVIPVRNILEIVPEDMHQNEEVIAIEELEGDSSFYAAHGRFVEAAEALEQAISIRQKFLGEVHPDFLASIESYAVACNVWGVQCLHTGNCPASLELLKKAEAMTEAENVPNFKRRVALRATTFNNLCCYYRNRGKSNAALQFAEKALKIEQRFKEAEKPARTHLNYAVLLSATGRHEEAMEHIERAVAVLHDEEQQLRHDQASDESEDLEQKLVETCSVLVVAHYNMFAEHLRLKQQAAGLECLHRAVNVAQHKLPESHPLADRMQQMLSEAKERLCSKASRATFLPKMALSDGPGVPDANCEAMYFDASGAHPWQKMKVGEADAADAQRILSHNRQITLRSKRLAPMPPPCEKPPVRSRGLRHLKLYQKAYGKVPHTGAEVAERWWESHPKLQDGKGIVGSPILQQQAHGVQPMVETRAPKPATAAASGGTWPQRGQVPSSSTRREQTSSSGGFEVVQVLGSTTGSWPPVPPSPPQPRAPTAPGRAPDSHLQAAYEYHRRQLQMREGGWGEATVKPERLHAITVLRERLDKRRERGLPTPTDCNRTLAATKIQARIRGFLVRQWTPQEQARELRRQRALGQNSSPSKQRGLSQVSDAKRRVAYSVIYAARRAFVEHAAATKIQSIARGVVTRIRLKRFIAEVAQEAARKVQAAIRIKLARARRRRRLAALERIQALARCLLARQRVHAMKQSGRLLTRVARGHLVRKHLGLEQEAATFIQRTVRGRRDRHRLERSQAAAVKIQSLGRGYACRQRLQRRHEAASRIAACWVGFTARDLLRRRHRAALRIQSKWRGLREYRYYKRLQNAARKIQARGRGAAVRSKLFSDIAFCVTSESTEARFEAKLLEKRKLLKLRQQNIRHIQRHCRGFLARSRLAVSVRSAVRIQALWRGFSCRQKLKARVIAATRIQAAFRRQKEEYLFSARKKAARHIQAMTRGWLERKRLCRKRWAVQRISAFYRGRFCRAKLQRHREAAAAEATAASEATVAEEQSAFEMHFHGLSLETVDQAAFKQELLAGFVKLGLRPEVAESLTISLRAGSVIAEIRGDASRVQQLQALPVFTLKVMGCLATAPEAAQKQAAGSGLAAVRQRAKGSTDEVIEEAVAAKAAEEAAAAATAAEEAALAKATEHAAATRAAKEAAAAKAAEDVAAQVAKETADVKVADAEAKAVDEGKAAEEAAAAKAAEVAEAKAVEEATFAQAAQDARARGEADAKNPSEEVAAAAEPAEDASTARAASDKAAAPEVTASAESAKSAYATKAAAADTAAANPTEEEVAAASFVHNVAAPAIVQAITFRCAEKLAARVRAIEEAASASAAEISEQCHSVVQAAAEAAILEVLEEMSRPTTAQTAFMTDEERSRPVSAANITSQRLVEEGAPPVACQAEGLRVSPGFSLASPEPSMLSSLLSSPEPLAPAQLAVTGAARALVQATTSRCAEKVFCRAPKAAEKSLPQATVQHAEKMSFGTAKVVEEDAARVLVRALTSRCAEKVFCRAPKAAEKSLPQATRQRADKASFGTPKVVEEDSARVLVRALTSRCAEKTFCRAPKAAEKSLPQATTQHADKASFGTPKAVEEDAARVLVRALTSRCAEKTFCRAPKAAEISVPQATMQHADEASFGTPKAVEEDAARVLVRALTSRCAEKVFCRAPKAAEISVPQATTQHADKAPLETPKSVEEDAARVIVRATTSRCAAKVFGKSSHKGEGGTANDSVQVTPSRSEQKGDAGTLQVVETISCGGYPREAEAAKVVDPIVARMAEEIGRAAALQIIETVTCSGYPKEAEAAKAADPVVARMAKEVSAAAALQIDETVTYSGYPKEAEAAKEADPAITRMAEEIARSAALQIIDTVTCSGYPKEAEAAKAADPVVARMAKEVSAAAALQIDETVTYSGYPKEAEAANVADPAVARMAEEIGRSAALQIVETVTCSGYLHEVAAARAADPAIARMAEEIGRAAASQIVETVTSSGYSKKEATFTFLLNSAVAEASQGALEGVGQVSKTSSLATLESETGVTFSFLQDAVAAADASLRPTPFDMERMDDSEDEDLPPAVLKAVDNLLEEPCSPAAVPCVSESQFAEPAERVEEAVASELLAVTIQPLAGEASTEQPVETVFEAASEGLPIVHVSDEHCDADIEVASATRGVVVGILGTGLSSLRSTPATVFDQDGGASEVECASELHSPTARLETIVSDAVDLEDSDKPARIAGEEVVGVSMEDLDAVLESTIVAVKKEVEEAALATEEPSRSSAE
eukprot:TRINITY_DN1902_c0_g1_i7.p1 TRINITY_DN1902_c0_g1~~TRINITY_DN1902_c0_g1_i7.p1  ORF type:complete len:2328 (-),score=580.35 TRINITY_DN1902_c0_g1_i7:67-7050(-)